MFEDIFILCYPVLSFKPIWLHRFKRRACYVLSTLTQVYGYGYILVKHKLSMVMHNSALETRIKNKIKQLFDEKKIKITRFSEDMGYSRGFISSILGKPKKFFNLEQIEKICSALDYPVARLFADIELGDLSRDTSLDMSLAEPPGPKYGSNSWKNVQAIPELQELINILLALPADTQKQLLDSLLIIARLTAQTERL